MQSTVGGYHHVSTIATDAQRNLDFYAGVLGLRLVKVTVNFDQPGGYHLYYGDGLGTPGTLMTCFPIPRSHTGQRGAGQATTISFNVPPGTLAYWTDRLRQHRVTHETIGARFGEPALRFYDPDGLQLELVSTADRGPRTVPWDAAPLSQDVAICGLYTATLTLSNCSRTHNVLQRLGFAMDGEDRKFRRYMLGSGGVITKIDVLCDLEAQPGLVASGSVHHVAFRVANREEQAVWREQLVDDGLDVTPVQDRGYFESIYFREPGGVLFELATDGPGFTIDESIETLGSRLCLPPQFEPRREELIAKLPPLHLPDGSPLF